MKWQHKTADQNDKLFQLFVVAVATVAEPSKWHTHTITASYCFFFACNHFSSSVFSAHLHFLSCAWHSSCFLFRLECVKRSTSKCHAKIVELQSSNYRKNDGKLMARTTTANETRTHSSIYIIAMCTIKQNDIYCVHTACRRCLSLSKEGSGVGFAVKQQCKRYCFIGNLFVCWFVLMNPNLIYHMRKQKYLRTRHRAIDSWNRISLLAFSFH